MFRKVYKNIIFCISTLFLISTSILASEADYISVNVYNQIFFGTLTEDSSSEDGLVTFTTAPDSDKKFTITGKLKNNQFNKKCTISYIDGTTQSVTYKNGLISGKVTSNNPDGTYQKFSCTSGNPYNTLTTHSKNGEVLDIDWFYQCTPIQDLLSNAISVEYNKLFSNLYDYIDLPIKVHGTVTAIYEASNRSFLKIYDKDNNFYLFEYQNPNTYKYSKAQVETPSIGDEVTVIGIIMQIRNGEENPLMLYEHALGHEIDFSHIQPSIADSEFVQAVKGISAVTDEDLEKEYPEFETIYCKIDKSNVSPLDLQYTYEEICKYPLYYKDSNITLTGSVVHEKINSANKLVELLVQKENSSEIYKISYKMDEDTEIDDSFSLLDATISCTGVFNENAKNMYYSFDTKTCGYILYPVISTTDITIQ